MSTIRGKYFDGNTAARHDVVVLREGGHMRMRTADGSSVLAEWDVDWVYRDQTVSHAVILRSTRHAGAQLELDRADDVWTLNLPAMPPSSSQHRSLIRHPLVWVGAIIGLIVAVCLAAAWLVSLALEKIPTKWESFVFSKLEEQNYGFQMCEIDAQQAMALEKMEQRLVTEAERDHVRIDIAAHTASNAFTFPNGRIYFMSGLLGDLKTPEEFAGIFAHELAHVENRDVSQNLAINFVLALIFNDSSTRVPASLLARAFSRSTEAQADASAIARLHAAGISVRGFHDFLQRMEKNDLPSMASFLSTHPLSRERVENLNKVNEDMLTTEVILEDSEWAALKMLTACNVVEETP